MSLQDPVTLGVLCLAVGATAAGSAAVTSLVIHLRRRSVRRQYAEIKEWIEEPPRYRRPEAGDGADGVGTSAYQRHPWAGSGPVTTAEFFVAADPPSDRHRREPLLFDQEALEFDPEPVLFDFDAEPPHPEPLRADPEQVLVEPVLDPDETAILPRLTDELIDEIVPSQRRSPPPGPAAALAASGLTWPPVHPVAANGYLPNTAPEGRYRAGGDD
ncbi:MAG: hypothetical protein HOV79_15575 [Hamadaea sp.]|nr:hypothetical protein [Hamadaea sp.]